MGKPTGFLEYPRCDGAHRPPAERLQDYAEFLLPPDPEELHRQSARCMDCGVPYCHAGMMVAGSSIGCPLMNLIPETNDLVYRGELKAAYERMRKTNPFPEITGRVCPALCEGSCTLGEHDRPVTIQEIERYVADTACANGWDQDPIPDAGDTGRTVAVVGAGPAGLACADSLRRLGHRVTAFERADRPGGFLMYGIPMMKLEKTLVLEQVRRLFSAPDRTSEPTSTQGSSCVILTRRCCAPAPGGNVPSPCRGPARRAYTQRWNSSPG